jgi:F420-non-reducing hydrogenase small subunit
MADKVIVAVAAGSYCGGCDMALIAINELLVPFDEMVEIKYWQFATDFKVEDVEKLADNEIDVCLHTGPIRTSEHVELAHLFRRKSKVMIAFGACSCFGGIPALANTFTSDSYFDEVYTHGFNMDDSGKDHPKEKSKHHDNKLTLPKLEDFCLPLNAEVSVDAYMPGCPPVRSQFETLLEIIADYQRTGKLPPKGAVLAGEKSVCDECDREKPETIVIDKFYRPHEINPDPDKCLLAQGIICLGPATRSGCGAICPSDANLPCRGCFGPTPNSNDLGLKMLSAIASIAGANNEDNLGPEGLRKLMDQIPDPFGTFYRFGAPQLLIEQKKLAEKKKIEQKLIARSSDK